jgi:hypothetical protein
MVGEASSVSDRPPLVARILEVWTVAMILVSGLVAAADDELDALFGVLCLIWLALVLTTTRRRSRLARWLLSFLFLLGLLAAWDYGELNPRNEEILVVLLHASTIIDLALLWSSPMSRWLNSGPGSEAAVDLVRGCGIIVLLALAIFAALSTFGLWPA